MSSSVKGLLDGKGYVRLTHTGGDDLTIVNAARVSFDRESRELSEADQRLLRYLAKHGHTSPFRHATIGFEIYAPLMVARQWWKHVVGAPFVDTPWNESSRRYVTEEPEFYVPDTFKAAPEDKKQGSGEPLEHMDNLKMRARLLFAQERGLEHYEAASLRPVRQMALGANPTGSPPLCAATQPR